MTLENVLCKAMPKRISANYAVASLLAALIAGCDAAEDVRVQELPALERASAEARVGLPELAGVWRFAGWELAPDDSAALERDLAGLGILEMREQRLDSLAGVYRVGDARIPFAGEVRRDSIVSLVTLTQDRRYLAGRASGDTLWVLTSSLLPTEEWPADARIAFVRAEDVQRFARLRGAAPTLAAADTAPPADSLAEARARALAERRGLRDTTPDAAPAITPAEREEPRRAEPQPAEPEPIEPQAQPEPQPSPEPAERPRPRPSDGLPGRPVDEPEPRDSLRAGRR